MKIKKIAIIGLGLMGGSLAASCRRRFPKVKILGVSRSRSAISSARRKKWIHQGTTKIDSSISDANLIVVCTPVDTLLATLKKLDKQVEPGTLVTDVGSVKGEICSAARKARFKNIQFIGAHPMVGSHRRGITAVNTQLYDKGYTFLIRPTKKELKAYRQVKAFWQKLCAKVIEVDAKTHDAIVGEISHLPHLVAVCMMLSIDPKKLRFAAKGLSDASRIAAGHPSIWLPILKSNKRAVLQVLSQFQRHLGHLQKEIRATQDKKLAKLLRTASRRRQQISL